MLSAVIGRSVELRRSDARLCMLYKQINGLATYECDKLYKQINELATYECDKLQKET